MDVSIPRLKKNIEIHPFDDNSSSEKFVLSYDSKHYVINKAVKELIEQAQSLSENFSSDSEVISEVEQKLHMYLPPGIFEQTEKEKARPPFVISVKLIPEKLLSQVTRWSKWLVENIYISVIFFIFILLHVSVVSNYSTGDAAPLTKLDGVYFLLLFILSFLVHEVGHASACSRFGQKHGAIGFGIYVIFPAFYADVSNAWKLNRKERAVIDISGLYFQAMFLIVVDVAFLLTQSNILIYLTMAVSLTMMHTLNPFFKFDGYWLLSDLSGTPNLHGKVRDAIYYYSRVMIGITPSTVKPEVGPLVIVYSTLMLFFTILMVTLMSNALSHYAVYLPEQLGNWYSKFENASGFENVFFLIFDVIRILFFPFIIFIGIGFYSIKMYSSFFIPSSKVKYE